MLKIPFIEELRKATGSIIIAGAGGGYDIFCGLPLYFALKTLGKKVFLANLTFCDFTGMKKSKMLNNGNRLFYST